MYLLTDSLLVEVYIKAVTLEYDDEFLSLLEKEIKKREICLKEVLNSSHSG